jgi:hypothetical protein
MMNHVSPPSSRRIVPLGRGAVSSAVSFFDVLCAFSFSQMLLELRDVQLSATDALVMRTSPNGSTYDSGASDYRTLGNSRATNNTSVFDFSQAAAFQLLHGYNGGFVQAAGASGQSCHDVQLFNYNRTGEAQYYRSTGVFRTSTPAVVTCEASGERASLGVIQAVRILPLTGGVNILSAEWFLWGLTL